MRDKPGERQLLAKLGALLEEYPSAGVIAGIVAVQDSRKALMTDVGTMGFSGLHFAVLGCLLLERASEDLRATGSIHLVSKIEKALAALDLATVDIDKVH